MLHLHVGRRLVMSAQSQSSPNDGKDAESSNEEELRSLSNLEIRNLTFSLFAWACTMSNVTLGKSVFEGSRGITLVCTMIQNSLFSFFFTIILVVGTSAVVALSIGSDASVSTLPLGAFVMGSAAVSLTITPWLFRFFSRKMSFISGLALGFMGTMISCLSVSTESLVLLVLGNFFFGMATGIGFYWRFTAVELVPPHWAARAVTLVVSGGCLAAFAGPETAHASKDMFNDDLEYLGVFVMTAVFGVLNLLFTLCVQFPDSTKPNTSAIEQNVADAAHPPLMSILLSSDFILPVMISGLAWAIMAVPMSVVRVAMHQVGFSVRQSLTVIEIHFLGMYSPGFVVGSLMKKYGPKKVCAIGGFIFALAIVCMLLVESDQDGNIGLWLIGLFVVGAGWNFAFTGATVWTADLYRKSPMHKEKVQAANDSLMFLFSGAWIVSSSYIFEAGGSQLDGWKTMNYVVIGLLGVFLCVTGMGMYLDFAKQRETVEDVDCVKEGMEEA